MKSTNLFALFSFLIILAFSCSPIQDSMSSLKDINCPDGVMPAGETLPMQCAGPIVYIDPRTGQLRTGNVVAIVQGRAAEDMTKDEVIMAAIGPYLPPNAAGWIQAAQANQFRDRVEKLQERVDGLNAQAEGLTEEINGLLTSSAGSQGFLEGGLPLTGVGLALEFAGEMIAFEQESRQQLIDFSSQLPPPTDIPPVGQTTGQLYPEQAKAEMGQNLVDHAEGQVENFKDQPDYAGRKGLIKIAKSAISGAKASYKEGQVAQGDVLYNVATTVADLALSVTPFIGWGKDLYEAWYGVNALTGNELSSYEKTMAWFGVVTGGIGSKLTLLTKFAILVKIFKKANKELGAAEKLTYETLEAANRLGIKDIDGLKKLAEVIEAPKVDPFSLTPTHALTMSKAEFQSLKSNMQKDGMLRETIKYVEFKDSRYIVDGHHRARAAKELGWKEVPVTLVELPYGGYTTPGDLFFP